MPDYTPEATVVVRQAQQEAWRLGYPFIQREQLFLGLLQDQTVIHVLSLLGADSRAIGLAVEQQVLPGMGAPPGPESIELLPTADQVYRQRALTAAALLGHTKIGPCDLFLGFLLEQHGIVAEVLTANGIRKEQVTQAISQLDVNGHSST